MSLREIDLKERQQAQSEVNAVADRARTQQRDVIEDSFRERGEARADMQQPQEGEE